jgi:CelD/BcsL family acetyltransferase involved in cellulose biosynthesis
VSGLVEIAWHTGADQLAEEWDLLADRTGANPFLRPGWIAAWREAFGTGEPLVVGARQEGKLVAVLPVERTGAAITSPTNWHTPVFGPVAESADAVAELTAALFAKRIRRVSLSFVDRRDPLHDALLDCGAAARYRTLDVNALRSPYLDLEGDWDECWRSLGSKRRNSLKRHRRKLEQRGQVTLGVIEDSEALDAQLEAAFQVEALGWKGERGTAIVSRPETDRFYRRIARWAAARGTFRLVLLHVDGRLVAFDYALEEGGHHYLLKTGFDPDYRDCAPGKVLRTMMIERAYALGLQRYEFLGAEDEYKREWTANAHERTRVHAFARSPRGITAWAAFRYGRPLAGRVLGQLRR